MKTRESKQHSVLYIRGIDSQIKKEFKKWCEVHGISMSRKIQEMMCLHRCVEETSLTEDINEFDRHPPGTAN